VAAEQPEAAVANLLRVAPENPSAGAVQTSDQAENAAFRQHSAYQAAAFVAILHWLAPVVFFGAVANGVTADRGPGAVTHIFRSTMCQAGLSVG
jgi:hypothetical protein